MSGLQQKEGGGVSPDAESQQRIINKQPQMQHTHLCESKCREGTCMQVQWLRLGTSNAGGPGLVPGQVNTYFLK